MGKNFTFFVASRDYQIKRNYILYQRFNIRQFLFRNVDILEPVSNAGVMGGISDTTPHTVNPSSNIHQQPKVVYATHGSHHHHHQNTTVEPPKEDQQLFHSTKF